VRSEERRSFGSIDEISQAVGEHLGFSEWTTVTQKQIDDFAETTGDRQWIHVDPVRAASGPFGTTVAHGYLTLSLVSMFIEQVIGFDDSITRINYGSERTRYPAPVPVDSRLRGGLEIVALDATAQGHRLRALITVEIEGHNKPACVTEMVILLRPQGGAVEDTLP
jgi:acyl dehydratase